MDRSGSHNKRCLSREKERRREEGMIEMGRVERNKTREWAWIVSQSLCFLSYVGYVQGEKGDTVPTKRGRKRE